MNNDPIGKNGNGLADVEPTIFNRNQKLKKLLIILSASVLLSVFILFKNDTPFSSRLVPSEKLAPQLQEGIDNASTSEPIILTARGEGGYVIKDGILYYFSREVPGVDIATLEVINDYWVRDKNNAYNGEKIFDHDEVDVGSLEILDGYVIKDNKNVYSTIGDKLQIVPNVDITSFQYVGTCKGFSGARGENYFRDKFNIYHATYGQDFAPNFSIKKLDYIDTSSFQYLGFYSPFGPGEIQPSVPYAKDKNNIYYACGEILKDADPNSFIDFTDGYAKDKLTVWYLGELIEGADSATFQPLTTKYYHNGYYWGDFYAKDKSNVYVGGHVLGDLDPATLVIVEGWLLEDQVFTIYLKDKNYVYAAAGYKVTGVNPTDCTPETFSKCKNDDYQRYNLGPF
ncbi:MAG: DKNYY domain-containing protein [Minisyncoccia bacterium]